MKPETTYSKYSKGIPPELVREPFGKWTRTSTIALLCIALITVILTVYLQAGNFQFLNYDEEEYVTNNTHVAKGITGKNIIWAFTTTDAANWHPITWLSHMADVQFYGMNPRGHHLTSVAIHTLSALLLFFLLLRLTGTIWQSLFVAALFALHPLHVESVAWVAERKDVLSALFWFLTLLFYAEYVAKRKTSLYILALFSFMLGLMSKPMLVTLPIVMLLLDFWPLGRCRHEDRQGVRQLSSKAISLVREKIPFFACSLLSGVITIYAQHGGGAMRSLSETPFRLRIENALVAYVKYICKTLWPRDLAVLYPFPPSIPPWQVIGSLVILLFLSAVAIRAGRRQPYFAVGWFWFLITLVPVIGLIQVGRQSMADRYSYIPVIGLFIIAAWGVPDLTKGLRHRHSILALLAGFVITASAVFTWQQLGYWRDSISLYQHTLQITNDNYTINNNMGNALADKGNLVAAIEQYRKAIQINPDYSDAHNNLGFVLTSKGDLDAAIHEYQEALRTNPNSYIVHNNLGIAFESRGVPYSAMRECQEALRINPNYSDAHNNLGVVLAGLGDTDTAILEYQKALQTNPDNSGAHNNLGNALANKGYPDAAIYQYQEALRISPNNEKAHNNLGAAFASKGDLGAAIKEYQEALRINPNYEKAQNNLGAAIARKGTL